MTTHSSIFLKTPQVISIQVQNDGSRKYASHYGSLYAHLHEFDISEAEYFESFNLIVITEGERDKAMLEGYAADVFESNRILLLSGTGIRSWEGFFSSVVFPMLASPKIVFLVDGFDSAKMNDSIAEAERMKKNGHPAVKFFFIREIPTWAKGESLGKSLTDTFAESLTRAVLSKDSHRIFFEATGDRDCIEWLPIDTFPLDEKSWDQVWVSAKQIAPFGRVTTGEHFKQYVKDAISIRNPRLSLTPDSLKDMAAMTRFQGRTPKRITKLVERLVNISKS